MTKTRDLADLGGGFIQAGTGATQRTVESKLQDVVSVKDFGAVGDGVTDDTAAIQAALNSGAKEVVVPASTYKVTSLSITSGLKLSGPGTLKRTAVLSSAIISITASGVTVDGITVAGPGVGASITTTNSAEAGILASGTNSTNSISNIFIRNCTVDGSAGFGIYLKYAKDSEVQSCVVKNCGYAGIGFLSVIDSQILGNRVDNIQSSSGATNWYGIFITRDPTQTLTNSARSTNCIVSENIVKNVPGWTGIDSHAPKNLIISSNRVYYCKNGIYAQYDDSGAAYPANAQDVIITDNVVEGPASSADSALGIASLGTAALKCERIKILNNIIQTAGDYNSSNGAIHVTNTDNAEVKNNTIEKAVRVGISVIGTTRYSEIEGNKINGVVAGASSASYMYFDLTSLDSVFVSRNVMQNTTGDAGYTPAYGVLYVAGTATSLVMSANRMLTLPSSAQIRSTGGTNNNFPDLSWILEQETIKFNYTTTGGSTYEAIGSKASSFRRLPTTAGTFIVRARITLESGVTANGPYQLRGNYGSIYTPAIYRSDGTNVVAGVVFTDITFTIEGIFWNN